jgi:hypothetical protein
LQRNEGEVCHGRARVEGAVMILRSDGDLAARRESSMAMCI